MEFQGFRAWGVVLQGLGCRVWGCRVSCFVVVLRVQGVCSGIWALERGFQGVARLTWGFSVLITSYNSF